MKVEYILTNNNNIFFYGTIDKDDMKSNLKVLPRQGFHSGYLEQWQFIENKIFKEIENITSEEIIISGHSLGGGVARVAVLCLAKKFKGKNFNLKTFGTPRSYTLHNRKEINKCSNIFKVEEYINRGDIVPRIPPPFPFFWLLGPKRKNRIIQGKFSFKLQKIIPHIIFTNII